ncbi:unnamed protein product [Brassica oleracea var. botrytis]
MKWRAEKRAEINYHAGKSREWPYPEQLLKTLWCCCWMKQLLLQNLSQSMWFRKHWTNYG